MRPKLKNTLELLPENQQKEFLALYNKQLGEIIQTTALKRTTLKLSRNLSSDEIRKAICQAMDIPLESVPPVNFEGAKTKVRRQTLKVEEIIHDYKILLEAKNAPKDKIEELYDIGRFIQASNTPIVFKLPERIQPFPDFEILNKNTLIGLEHTRLIDGETKAMVNAAKHYIKKAEELIKPELSHLSVTINFFINYYAPVIGESDFCNRTFSDANKKEIPKLIANFVRSIVHGLNEPQPSFISNYIITDNKDSRIDLELAESYLTSSDFLDLLIEGMVKKELKANRYRHSARIDELWLVIIIDDLNSFCGFDLSTIDLPKLVHSNFDRIYLFEKFDGIIYSLTSGKEG